MTADASRPATIAVRYTCEACGISEREVLVQARLVGEDIAAWMRVLQMRVGADHATVSPQCDSTAMTSVMVPLEDNRGVGLPSRADQRRE